LTLVFPQSPWVWVGNNNNDAMKDVTGLTGAAPSARRDGLLPARQPAEWYLRPRGLVNVQVDATPPAA